MNKKQLNLKFFVSKVAQIVVSVGGMATITGCTTLFHENKVPSELIDSHPFAANKE
ncbi:hypothetical protein [Bacillus sp. CGMCC 1.16541]|uniref:hypothetical protein n=1 Tax=Bacillus sp. CGMCC 1.16541 TaxID=2185143 RepID=UPI000D73BFAA|nr:hypothetical protein [Bacillus sp. CGMCC 1.16541]